MEGVINKEAWQYGQIVQTNTENIAGKVYNGLELKCVSVFTWKKALQRNIKPYSRAKVIFKCKFKYIHEQKSYI